MSVKPAHPRTLAAVHEHLRRAIYALHPSRFEFADAYSRPLGGKHRAAAFDEAYPALTSALEIVTELRVAAGETRRDIFDAKLVGAPRP